MVELFCIEIATELISTCDPVFLDDDRVLRNLLSTEDRYVITSSYFKCTQTDMKPYMRKIVSSWMLEVSTSSKLIFPESIPVNQWFLINLIFSLLCLVVNSRLLLYRLVEHMHAFSIYHLKRNAK